MTANTPVTVYFSFGHGQTDPDTGENLLDKYVTITGPSYEACREAMFASRYGNRWSFDYLAGTASADKWIPRWTEHDRIEVGRSFQDAPIRSDESIGQPEDIGRLKRTDAEHRAAVVAGIRALADLIESNPDVPVPNSVVGQHSIIVGTDGDKEATVVETAATLHAELEIDADVAVLHHYVAQGGYPHNNLPYFRVEYVVHGKLDGTEAGEPDE
ncbi:MAG: hypothetical protein ABW046_07070 [Actinoplanes sp.]